MENKLSSRNIEDDPNNSRHFGDFRHRNLVTDTHTHTHRSLSLSLHYVERAAAVKHGHQHTQHCLPDIAAPRGPVVHGGPAEAGDQPADDREDVEADGQGCQAVPEPQAEPEKQPALHTGHPARHVPAPQAHLLEARAGRGHSFSLCDASMGLGANLFKAIVIRLIDQEGHYKVELSFSSELPHESCYFTISIRVRTGGIMFDDLMHAVSEHKKKTLVYRDNLICCFLRGDTRQCLQTVARYRVQTCDTASDGGWLVVEQQNMNMDYVAAQRHDFHTSKG